ncbi:6448_t:CDS:2, partial [Cetraspora pellucida]
TNISQEVQFLNNNYLNTRAIALVPKKRRHIEPNMEAHREKERKIHDTRFRNGVVTGHDKKNRKPELSRVPEQVKTVEEYLTNTSNSSQVLTEQSKPNVSENSKANVLDVLPEPSTILNMEGSREIDSGNSNDLV